MAVRQVPEEPIGRRVARLRAAFGWNQSDLAQRLAMSRTAVSHLEAGMSRPSERTLILLAGLFRIEPPELVEGTDYPLAQAERLPLTAARYTHVDFELARFEAQIALKSALDTSSWVALVETWTTQLESLYALCHDTSERLRVRSAIQALRDAHALR